MKRDTLAACVLVAFGLVAIWYATVERSATQLQVTFEEDDWVEKTTYYPFETLWSRTVTVRNTGRVACSWMGFPYPLAKPQAAALEQMAASAASSYALLPGKVTSSGYNFVEPPTASTFLFIFTRSPAELTERLARRKRYPWLKLLFPLPYKVIEIPPRRRLPNLTK